MDGFDRIYDLHKILSGRKTPIPLAEILSQMECSRATFNRVKRHMTDYLGAPIAYNRDLGGYYYQVKKSGGGKVFADARGGDARKRGGVREPGSEDKAGGDNAENGAYELPGIWLNQEELHALVLIHGLLSDIGSGLLRNQLAPVRRRFEALLAQRAIDPCSLADKVRMVGATYRPVKHGHFVRIATGLFSERCLRITYESRTDDVSTDRTVSPQRLVHYRGNWYLDCWCHMRRGLRTFALECITRCQPSEDSFKKIAVEELDAHFQPTYGIFSGQQKDLAQLLFAPAAARRVKDEEWHPDQAISVHADGSLEMTLPFNPLTPQELVKDILSFGDEVKVLGPEELQNRIKEKLRQACAQY